MLANARRASTLLIGVSLVALAAATPAAAQSESTELNEVVVTGSRVITNGANSPTPLTVVAAEQLRATTPTNIPDALNKLPVFQGSQQPRRPGNGSINQGSNVLALRGFGAQRTLVLVNGHRATPSNADGTVSADTLPQMLVERVDVVTGGASAVYGSDAVSGVINFVLDTDFTGLKFDVNAGLSDYHDGASYKFGVAGGAELFGGRGHIIGSYERFHQDPVQNMDRPLGGDIWVTTGNGSASNPFRLTRNVRRADSTFGGLITSCTNPCPVRGQHFVGNGVLGPFNPGLTTGTSNQNQGGDGAFSIYSTALVEMQTDQLFSRFSYDLTDNIEVYIQGSYAEQQSKGYHFPVKLTPGSGQASTFFKNNPFLTPAVQAALGNNGLSDATNTFQLGQYFVNTGREGLTGVKAMNQTVSVEAGVSGKLFDRFNWDVYYTHGENRSRVNNLNNSDYQKQFAALDAVRAPDGSIKCYATVQGVPGYADCVPMNPFGPTALTPEAFRYFTATTQFVMTNIMDNVGASITGDAFQGWAGPIRFALSGEARWNKYEVDSNANPADNVNCTGLRICASTLPRWAQPVLADVSADNNVWEVAAELQVPVVRDLPLVDSFDLNLAARYTDYSTSGPVRTWKVGFDWNLSEEFRLRGTRSRDIRAPTLNDLFQPAQAAVTGFVDAHTSSSNTLFAVTQGNPNLTPEKADTFTFGAVWRPSVARGLTVSLDYYKIKMDNAIGEVNPSNNAVQQICEASNGTSPYCALFIRPLPFSDRTPANFPTRVIRQSLNTALLEIEGYDFEASYGFEMSDVVSAWSGSWTLRTLANYQPENRQQPFTGAPLIMNAAPDLRVTVIANYRIGDWTIGVQDRWLSGYSQKTTDNQFWVNPDVKSFNTVDLNIQRNFEARGAEMTAYFTVQNLLNEDPGIVAATGSIGLNYPAAASHDIMGRYWTIGLRGRL